MASTHININSNGNPAPLVPYRIRVFIRGLPGYFSYEVATRDQAVQHMGEIVAKGYRRNDDRGHLVQYMPAMIDKVIVEGAALMTAYPDLFIRT